MVTTIGFAAEATPWGEMLQYELFFEGFQLLRINGGHDSSILENIDGLSASIPSVAADHDWTCWV